MQSVTTPSVSILIPCYNCATHLQECIQSALSQTYPNKEVIFWDDGSTDESLTIAKSYSSHVTIISDRHAGQAAVKNSLFKISRGEWIQYLDADDYLLPVKISNQLGSGLSADIYASEYLILENEQFSYVRRPTSLIQHLQMGIRWQPNSLLIKRGILDSLINKQGFIWRDAAAQSSNFYLDVMALDFHPKLIFTEGANCVYRKNWSSHQRTNSSTQSIDDLASIISRIQEFYAQERYHMLSLWYLLASDSYLNYLEYEQVALNYEVLRNYNLSIPSRTSLYSITNKLFKK